jgi:ribosomal protein S1
LNGRVVKPADQDKARMIWQEILEHHKNGTTIKGRVLNPINSGYCVGVGGVVGFLPFSMCSLLTASKVGLLQDFHVEDAEPAKRNLVLSDPEVRAQKEARKQAAADRAARW